MIITASSPVKQQATLSYSGILTSLTNDKWTLVTEGVSGAQLKRPRVMLTQTKVVLAIGVVGLFAFGIGLLFILVGLLDYYVGQKELSHFLSRENPSMPRNYRKPGMPRVFKLMLGLIVLSVLCAIILPLISTK